MFVFFFLGERGYPNRLTTVSASLSVSTATHNITTGSPLTNFVFMTLYIVMTNKIMRACRSIEYNYSTLGLESRVCRNYFSLLPMCFDAVLSVGEYKCTYHT